MNSKNIIIPTIAGLAFIIGLSIFGVLIKGTVVKYKSYDRTVSVKGLSEREYPADIVIWPIKFVETGNDSSKLYLIVENKTQMIENYLLKMGLSIKEINHSQPSVTDKSARNYEDGSKTSFRYTSTQTITVYSQKVDLVKSIMSSISELGKQGIVFTGNDWQTEYIFNRLNEVKPEMIEEATANARKAALKFANDSNSKLGKIKTAYQGQFSISSRDKNNPQIKKVRVVSTVEYYLTD